jgi:hypothetical protein
LPKLKATLLLGDFSTFIKTTIFARHVGHCFRTTVTASGQRYSGQSMMASALITTGTGFMLFWNSHNIEEN